MGVEKRPAECSTNEYVFLHVHVVSVRQVFEAEQALRGSFTGRRGSGR